MAIMAYDNLTVGNFLQTVTRGKPNTKENAHKVQVMVTKLSEIGYGLDRDNIAESGLFKCSALFHDRIKTAGNGVTIHTKISPSATMFSAGGVSLVQYLRNNLKAAVKVDKLSKEVFNTLMSSIGEPLYGKALSKAANDSIYQSFELGVVKGDYTVTMGNCSDSSSDEDWGGFTSSKVFSRKSSPKSAEGVFASSVTYIGDDGEVTSFNRTVRSTGMGSVSFDNGNVCVKRSTSPPQAASFGPFRSSQPAKIFRKSEEQPRSSNFTALALQQIFNIVSSSDGGAAVQSTTSLWLNELDERFKIFDGDAGPAQNDYTEKDFLHATFLQDTKGERIIFKGSKVLACSKGLKFTPPTSEEDIPISNSQYRCKCILQGDVTPKILKHFRAIPKYIPK